MQPARYRRIVLFFARLLLNLAFWDLLLPRLGLGRLSQGSRSRRLRRIGAQFRALAVRMGGVLIKVGQFLSARVDVLPDEVTQELASLQDEVPAESLAAIRRVVEAEFNRPLEAVFAEFSQEPEAAASLGQVHRARILRHKTGENGAEGEPQAQDVVVKVQRPGIEQLIATDLAALRTVGGWLQRYPPIRRRVNLMALLDEFTRILHEEVDYLAEGRNAETFAENFRDRPGVRVPAVIWEKTTRRVLALEDVRAIKITDYAAIAAAGIDRAEVANRLFHTYLQQIFEDRFFHADPHPGNLFVSPLRAEDAPGEQPGAWLLTFVDFGMVGRVPPNLQAGIRELAIAIGTRDAARLVKSYQMLGVLLPGADLSLLEKAEDRMFDLFWGKTLGELQDITPQEVRQYAMEFRQLIYTMPFQVPEDLILLGRTVGILAGMCTGLHPDFNLWSELAPYTQRLIAEEAAGRPALLEALEVLARRLLGYPRRVGLLLEKMEKGELAVQVPQLAEKVSRLEWALNRAAWAIVFAALLLGGVQLLLAGQFAAGGVLLGGAALVLFWIFLSMLKPG